MSTKIHNGFVIHETNWQKINQLMKDIRAEILPIARSEYLKTMANYAENLAAYVMTGYKPDIAFTDWDNLPTSPKEVLFEAQRQSLKIMRQNKAAFTITEFNYDFAFSLEVTLFPMEDKTLGIFYCDNENITKAFINNPAIHDYSYWDNVDKPYQVTDEEWEQRDTDWHKALPGIGIPAENGFSVHIIDAIDHAYVWLGNHYEEFFGYFTPTEEFKINLAKQQMRQAKMDELFDGDKNKIMRCYHQARTYVDEHPDEVKALADTLQVNAHEFFKL